MQSTFIEFWGFSYWKHWPKAGAGSFAYNDLYGFTYVIIFIMKTPLYSQAKTGLMDIREYILYVCLLHPHVLIERVVPLIFMVR